MPLLLLLPPPGWRLGEASGLADAEGLAVPLPAPCSPAGAGAAAPPPASSPPSTAATPCCSSGPAAATRQSSCRRTAGSAAAGPADSSSCAAAEKPTASSSANRAGGGNVSRKCSTRSPCSRGSNSGRCWAAGTGLAPSHSCCHVLSCSGTGRAGWGLLGRSQHGTSLQTRHCRNCQVNQRTLAAMRPDSSQVPSSPWRQSLGLCQRTKSACHNATGAYNHKPHTHPHEHASQCALISPHSRCIQAPQLPPLHACQPAVRHHSTPSPPRTQQAGTRVSCLEGLHVRGQQPTLQLRPQHRYTLVSCRQALQPAWGAYAPAAQAWLR